MPRDLLRIDNLSLFVAIFVGIFSVLITLYSIGFMRKRKGLLRYYLYIVLTLIASLGSVFANNLIVFIAFWGFLGFLLYVLIVFEGTERASATAKKAFIIIGGSDALMLLGMALIWNIAGSLQMHELKIPLTTPTAVVAYLCLAAGAFAKAGAMPFHTWIPDTAEDAPTPVTALLPASLDKLLGIYFLARISLDVFVMSPTMNTILMAVGSITIVAAVMMALVQHDLKRLLGYHAVSQVGYMVVGIGTGTLIGIAGGLFHMLNNALYKSCLFLSGGVIEKRTGTTDLGKLGGFVKIMPVTFMTFLIAALAISGVPPLNGFVSKWMIYQGVIASGSAGGSLWVLWLVAAVFGSALTLASFMKLVHTVFLGQPSVEVERARYKAREATPSMLIPSIILAVLCVVFGVFAYRLPLGMFIMPSLKGSLAFSGVWSPGLATILIIAGIALGFIIYALGTVTKARESEGFVGGEALPAHPEMRISGVEFYNTVKDIRPFGIMYWLAEHKVFDIYEVGRKITLCFTAALRYIHNGVLSSYLSWCLLGMIVLFYVLFR
jgi:NADH:ubiquinone oxidoreductase subunit 5 (subunit L)/multisubunit Na+/H+ antiporter MnhA subunit